MIYNEEDDNSEESHFIGTKVFITGANLNELHSHPPTKPMISEEQESARQNVLIGKKRGRLCGSKNKTNTKPEDFKRFKSIKPHKRIKLRQRKREPQRGKNDETSYF